MIFFTLFFAYTNYHRKRFGGVDREEGCIEENKYGFGGVLRLSGRGIWKPSGRGGGVRK